MDMLWFIKYLKHRTLYSSFPNKIKGFWFPKAMDTTKICEKLYRYVWQCLILETNTKIDAWIYKLQIRKKQKMKFNKTCAHKGKILILINIKPFYIVL